VRVIPDGAEAHCWFRARLAFRGCERIRFPVDRAVCAHPEACESGRIGTIGNRVWGDSPWVQIPPPPLMDTPTTVDDDAFMALALAEAAAASAHGDVPVGAVAVRDGEVIAARHNEREKRADPTAHAELLALADAARVAGTWRLSDVTLYVTLEPCAMCAGGLVAARVERLVFGAHDPKAGACGSLYNLCADPRLNHEVAVQPGVRADESAALLSQFFSARRGR
jgi:tRNA(adenine34) deaminase